VVAGARPSFTPSVSRLIDRIDAAVQLGNIERITNRIKNDLESQSRAEPLRLPEAVTRPCEDCYARRLLHRNPELGYTVVVMVWGPGQRTQLHDHAGIWCVECVVEGQIDVTRYDLRDETDGRCLFDEKDTVRAGVGDAGRLIPPFEYHVIANGLADSPSISLHVYGGEMEHCNLYVPLADGSWERTSRELTYTH